MALKEIVFSFILGGSMTAAIVGLEESGHRGLSGFATLVPVFTLVSYVFIGESRGGSAVSAHSKFVLIGTLLSWVPYMIVISILAPRIGPNKAIACAFAVFFILAAGFVGLVERYDWFQ